MDQAIRLADAATEDLAYLAHLQRIENVDPKRRIVVRERHVTHVARKEDDGWRIVHRHSDPLVEPKSLT